ncbi:MULTISPECIES: DNA polymerase III subunit delta [Clostridium]|uniref:DNA polymerase III subunit delta n=1 Tax=Clostridium TaxID=1485 RepID=UPI00069F6AE8|nr:MULTISPECIES: DNA polymerase III subunit delta [Clostridium]KOF56735.1 DNA polymerase III subunit delta [Clostridium sp. DMHC 10]MCD2347537.1 DNA polymerase III subunit delta [Clostridium guangxiense]
MINYLELDDDIKKGNLKNSYIIFGFNEQLIKDYIKKIIGKLVNKDFISLNYDVFDGSTVDFNSIYNALETVPFMSEKRVVVVYRANFLGDNSKNFNKNGDDIVKSLENYITKIPKQSVFIMYYVFDNPRERISKKIRSFEKKTCVVEFSKLKGLGLQKKVKEIFESKGKNIGKAELSFFCSKVDDNVDVIINEAEKLCCYAIDRDITHDDIELICHPKESNDIFNLVDFISQSKPEKAIEILNEIMFKGEKASVILYMIERQFRIMLNLRIGMESGKSKETLSKELRLNIYICDKMMHQCKSFSVNKIVGAIDLCLSTEKELKSLSGEAKFKMELLIINIAILR